MITSLTDILQNDSNWIVDPLLQKQKSIILAGNVEDTSLLALQLALDVAAGKPFLGEYPTSLGKVLSIEKDKARLRENGHMLARRQAGTDNVSVVDSTENLANIVRAENPLLTILGNFPASLDYLEMLAKTGSTIAIAGNEWTGNLPVQEIWNFYPSQSGYRLNIRSENRSLMIGREEKGFVLQGVEELKPATGPVWSTEKSLIRKGSPAIQTGIKV